MPPIIQDQSIIASNALDIGALLEFSRILNECDDPAAIYSTVLFSLMGKLGLGSAAVALADDEGRYTVTFAKGGATRLLGMSFTWSDCHRQGMFSKDHPDDGGVTDMLAAQGIEGLVPICSGQQIFSILMLGAPMVDRGDRGIGDGGHYAMLVGTIAAMALEGCKARGSLREANRRLERRIHRLRSLFEAGAEFNTIVNRDSILRLLGYTLMGEMAIRHFAVALRDDRGYSLAANRFKENFSPALLDEVACWDARALPSRNGLNEREGALYDLGIRAVVPMDLQGSRRGLLMVGERLRFPIDEEDIEYLVSLANLATGALENVRLLDEMIGKQRMEEDLRIAAEIQQGLLPRSLPVLDGIEIAAETIPTQQVGGDCYDVIELTNGRVLLSIADVSGKGTPASLLMANVQAAVRTLAQLDLTLDDFTARINDVIYQNTSPDKFITAFFGLLDAASGTFTYVNAGHNPPLLFGRDGVSPLDRGGVILGIMPSFLPYEVGSIELRQGDLLVLYTDGVSEALNVEREEYGEERLRALFESDRECSAAGAIERLREDVLAFTSGAPQSDDITILSLRRG
jgi:sigma-B regulation protein RsbU (phosphoserine phosphatase)